jgi:hypothetical protein
MISKYRLNHFLTNLLSDAFEAWIDFEAQIRTPYHRRLKSFRQLNRQLNHPHYHQQ